MKTACSVSLSALRTRHPSFTCQSKILYNNKRYDTMQRCCYGMLNKCSNKNVNIYDDKDRNV